MTARCRATGYKHLMYSLNNRARSVEVNFPASALKHKSGDEYYILSSDLVEYSGQIFSSGITVEYFNADTLFYRFPFENHKTIPVEAVFSLAYRMQYMSDGRVEISPDSVIVYGEPSRLESISSINTEPIRHSDLHSDVSGTVKLEQIQGVRLSDSQISYSIDVVRFTELQTVTPIGVINVPDGKTLSVYPSVARVSVKYEFPPVSGFTEEVSLVVDYNEYQESLSGKCRVRMAAPKEGVISYEINPPYVECIAEER